MPASLATLLTVVAVVGLLVHESKMAGRPSAALWLPVFWIVIAGSRFVSQWLNLDKASAGGADGSPLDAAYFGTLIIAGLVVLIRRRVRLAEVLRNNQLLAAFLLYCLVSVTWSEFPLIAIKRYIKALGHPVMALIIITDRNPTAALQVTIKRCACLMMPLSLLFIKYLPEYGRGFSKFTGQAYNNGIMHNKNELGYACMVFGLFYAWILLGKATGESRRATWHERLINFGMLCLIVWLLFLAQSATSVTTLLIGVLVLSVVGLPAINKKLIGTYILIAIAIAVGLEWTFDVYARLLALLGRDSTLTDRTALWGDVIALVENPLLGAGFESFWLGSRIETLWHKWWWRPNQAHNGYIETYLNLGIIGLLLLAGLMVGTFRKIRTQLLQDLYFAQMRLGCLVAILFYNYTEAAFKGVHLVWTVFFIIALDYPGRVHEAKERVRSARTGDSMGSRRSLRYRYPSSRGKADTHSTSLR